MDLSQKGKVIIFYQDLSKREWAKNYSEGMIQLLKELTLEREGFIYDTSMMTLTIRWPDSYPQVEVFYDEKSGVYGIERRGDRNEKTKKLDKKVFKPLFDAVKEINERMVRYKEEAIKTGPVCSSDKVRAERAKNEGNNSVL